MVYVYLLAFVVLIVLLPVLVELSRKPMNDAARAGAEGHFAKLPSGTTYYEWHGPANGPVAVLVHGLSTPSFVWKAITPRLVKMGFRVLSYDHYGRGFSDRTKNQQSAEFFCNVLNELLEDQGVKERFSLFGYSMGGGVVTAYAARFPERLNHLTLIAPAGLKHDLGGFTAWVVGMPVLGDWMYTVLGGRQFRKGIEAEAAGLPVEIKDVHALQLRELEYRGYLPSMLSSMRHLLDGPLEREHKAIEKSGVPTLAIWGETDEVIPISGKDSMAALNPSAMQVSVEGAPHSLPYTHSQSVEDAFKRLLEKTNSDN
ncbi:alpha/beta fold hydrolase [Cochlodiniinecator piscidefendens]|uniref:alpha/beta fold hydrolase n=1 Tax=Cochlodiniinecator piscidefendens TaxID=2715756 RepID=UPI00197B9912|nr:alpha/beta hydrolase [Cochlodiniinecator piscidefendens]